MHIICDMPIIRREYSNDNPNRHGQMIDDAVGTGLSNGLPDCWRMHGGCHEDVLLRWHA